MGKRKNNTLAPKKATRSMKNVCWVGTEGRTERDYLRMDVFRDNARMVVKLPIKESSSKTNPEHVVKQFKGAMVGRDFRKGDEAWLVVDTDSWGEDDVRALGDWEKSDARNHLAISNPKFELFLVMHFNKAKGCTTPQVVDATLKRYMPNYKKRLSPRAFDEGQVRVAISNAEEKRRTCTNAWSAPGVTDVYKLIETLLGPVQG